MVQEPKDDNQNNRDYAREQIMHFGVRNPTQRIFILWVLSYTLASIVAWLAAPLLFSSAHPLIVMALALLLTIIAQEYVLRRFVPGLPVGEWTLTTLAGAVLVVLLTFLVETVIPVTEKAIPGSNLVIESNAWLRYLIAILMAPVAGAIIALAQFAVLRPYVAARTGHWRSNRRWMAYTAIGWFAASVIILGPVLLARIPPFPASNRAEQSSEFTLVTLLGIIIGTAIIGLFTGQALSTMRPRTREDWLISLEEDSRTTLATVIASYLLSCVSGIFWLWAGVSLAIESFQWPRWYTGPGVTSFGPPPDDFFVAARLLTGGIVILSAIQLILATVLLAQAVKAKSRTSSQQWKHYWAPMLASFVALWVLNLWAFLAWYSTYTD